MMIFLPRSLFIILFWSEPFSNTLCTPSCFWINFFPPPPIWYRFMSCQSGWFEVKLGGSVKEREEQEESQECVLNQIWQKKWGFSCGAQVDLWSPHTLSQTHDWITSSPPSLPPPPSSLSCLLSLSGLFYFYPSIHSSALHSTPCVSLFCL